MRIKWRLVTSFDARKCFSQVAYGLILLISAPAFSVDTIPTILTMKDAVDLAMNNNHQLKIYSLLSEQAELEKKSAIDIGNTEITYRNGKLYGIENSQYMEVNQNFGSIIKNNRERQKAQIDELLITQSKKLAETDLCAKVKSTYMLWQYDWQISQLDSEELDLYSRLVDIAELKYKSGDISLLKKTLMETKVTEIHFRYMNSLDDISIAQNKLKQLIGTDKDYLPEKILPEMYTIDRSAEIVSYSGNLYVDYKNTLYLQAAKEIDINKSEYFPELKAGAFSQSVGSSNNLFGWQIGLAFPLWFPKQNADIRIAKINSEIALAEIENQKQNIQFDTENLLYELNKYFHQIRYFEDVALAGAEIILQTASLQLQSEEIEYAEFLESVSNAFNIRRQYCEVILKYNQTAVELEKYAK